MAHWTGEREGGPLGTGATGLNQFAHGNDLGRRVWVELIPPNGRDGLADRIGSLFLDPTRLPGVGDVLIVRASMMMPKDERVPRGEVGRWRVVGRRMEHSFSLAPGVFTIDIAEDHWYLEVERA